MVLDAPIRLSFDDPCETTSTATTTQPDTLLDTRQTHSVIQFRSTLSDRASASSILEQVHQVIHQQPTDHDSKYFALLFSTIFTFVVAFEVDLPPSSLDPSGQQTFLTPLVPQRTPTASSTLTQHPTPDTSHRSLEVLTNVISGFLTPSVAAVTDKRRHRLDRPYGESLTTVEALQKVQEKENKAQKRKKSAPSTKRPRETTKPPAKR